MSDGLLAVDVLLDDTVLVDTDGGQDVEGLLVGLLDTVKDEADDDLLPGGAALVPEGGLLQVYDVTNVLHDTMEGSGHEKLVLVIVGDSDQKLGVPVVHAGAQVVTILEGEIVGITGGGGVAHIGELAAATLDITILRLDGVPDGAGNGIIDAQDGTLDKLDLTGTVTLQTASSLGLLTTKPALLGIDSGRWPAISKAGILKLDARVATLCRILSAAILGGSLGLLRVVRSIGFGKTVSGNGSRGGSLGS